MRPSDPDRLWQSRHRHLRAFARVVMLERELSLHERPRTANCPYLCHIHLGARVGLYSGQGSVFQGDRVNLLVLPMSFSATNQHDTFKASLHELVKLSAVLGDELACKSVAGGFYEPAGNFAFVLEGMQAYRHVVKERLSRAFFKRSPVDDVERIVANLKGLPLWNSKRLF